jgi:nucleoside-diphosphate-sugar epimerase
MSRLFITGADGFTGVHLVNLAKKNSYEVYESKALLTDIVALKTEINSFKPEYVVHLAAISSTVSNHFNEIYETNLIGTLNLLNLLNIEGVKPKKVLLASSAQVYGNQGEKPFTEDSQLAPFNHYGVSKMSMEYMASQFFNAFPIVFLRPFNYTGVGHNAHFVIPKIVNHFKNKVESMLLNDKVKVSVSSGLAKPKEYPDINYYLNEFDYLGNYKTEDQASKALDQVMKLRGIKTL